MCVSSLSDETMNLCSTYEIIISNIIYIILPAFPFQLHVQPMLSVSSPWSILFPLLISEMFPVPLFLFLYHVPSQLDGSCVEVLSCSRPLHPCLPNMVEMVCLLASQSSPSIGNVYAPSHLCLVLILLQMGGHILL